MKIPETLKWKATGKTLGQGGQGVVHEVINKEEQNGKKYALKAFSKGKPLEAYQRFYREIKVIKGKFSISLGNSYWIPAFAGMTIGYKCLSFPRKRESSGWSQNMIRPDLLRTYNKGT